ncbi:amphi-Trp domain-containing protein [Nesterenkonia alba]|uniref:amphi-Trp domain-containing protein n=1 Tax=Nesterenkonia alba TaxID=515814 RepID=UPI0003B31D67|nr:amphi-Trp domain-containing protein [Nesterenkonia alba]
MPSERLMKSSQTLDREGLATLLETVAGRIRQGRAELHAGETNQVSLEIPERTEVDLEVTRETKTRGTKLELEVEVSWYEGEAAAESGELRIQ